ncbi:hypothetical protein ACHAXR_011212 [Thalassiosira sp. AJA248-18]
METARGGTKNEASSDKESETMLPQNEHAADQQGSDDGENSRDDTPKVEIPDDDLIVQILARLDGPSYRQSLYQDAGSINENFLVPPHFPWHSRKRLPQKMVKTLPRDIDDLHVISQCQDELHAPDKFGFGRYENGQSRGNYSIAPLADSLSFKTFSGASAAARRSHDPGVLELNTQMQLPSSIDAVMNTTDPQAPTPAEKWKAELLKDSAHSEMLSHLPFHWGKKGEPHSVEHSGSGKPEAHVELSEDGTESQKLTGIRSRSRAQKELATACMRKWKISLKVGGVSSRTTLFPSSTVIDTCSDQVMGNTRKVIRPMLRLAYLPQSVQAGQTVPTETATEMDNAGLAHSLGSYDCRYIDALLNHQKRDSSNRTKRVEVGRTRLVWSNLIQGDEPFLPSTRNRVNFNSLITGQRVDASKCKRPTEVKVGVRLNGRIITEEAIEDIPTTTNTNARKRKHSTRQSENEAPALKMYIQCPESRTDEEIDSALSYYSNHLQEVQPREDKFFQRSTANGAVVYLEMGDQSSSHTDIDRNEIIAALLKLNQKKTAQKKLKRSASSDTMLAEAAPIVYGGSQVIKRSNPPRFACVPLEDGLMRTVCLNAGTMSGAAVHQVIREISEQKPGRRCSVCWSDEGTGKEGVAQCVKCGLLAHSKCCLDKGEFSASSSVSPKEKEISECTRQGQGNNMNGAANVDGERSDDQTEEWQCAVCCRYTRREPKPRKFADGETYSLSNNTGGNVAANINANMPGPRCSLCPHRGGAMSQLESASDVAGHSHKWAHEVCRIWNGLDISDDPKLKECSSLFQEFPNGSPLSTVCALCGTGRMKGNKSMQFNGLTRCAARGCFVAFHPMCALLASKVGMDDSAGKAKSVRTRKTRHTEQAGEEKKSDDNHNIEADKKLCKEYTLQLVQLTRTEGAVDSAGEDDKSTIIPVAFCGIHNPQREDSFFGCLPGHAGV